MQRALITVFALLVLACGARPASSTVPVAPVAAGPATSLDEALSRAGLTRVEVTRLSRTMTSDLGAPPRVESDHVIVVENAGYSASPSIFARRSDGAIVLVSPQVNVIVDRHVSGGCRGFAGGRGWFEEVDYQLAPGSTYAGIVSVAYDEHTEVVDYTATEADGSPCPPPALD